MELAAGLAAVIVSINNPSLTAGTIWAIVVVVVLSFGYYFRYSFEQMYDVAETMRRQSVLSEGLNWPISKSQFNEWRSKAGEKILGKFSLQSRPDNYYETKQSFGARRLAEMTFESTFWTKNLYKKMKKYIWSFLGLAIIFFIVLISLSPLPFADEVKRIYLVYL